MVAAAGPSSFEWVPGRLEVIASHACTVRFNVLTAGAAWLSKWNINHTVASVAKEEPLYSDLQIGRDGAMLVVGYASVDAVSKLTALDGRQVVISESQVKLSVRGHESPAAAARSWKEYYFGGDADASPTVLEALFQQGEPGRGRPDTLVVSNMPIKWLCDEASPYASRAANAKALRGPMEALVGSPVAAVEAVVPDALAMRMDVYVKCRHLEDVERAFARLYGKALRYVLSGLTAAAEVEVDRTGFFTPAASAARAQAEEQEMVARRHRQAHRERLGTERAALRAWLEEAKRQADAEETATRESDLFDILQEQLQGLRQLLDDGDARDGDAKHPGPEGVDALRTLVELQQRAEEAKSKIEHTKADIEDDRQERRRLQQVRDVRVAKAKQLKALDERWRGVLEAAAEGVKGTALCAGLVDATQRALARARDLVLREAARIVNAQEYAEALQESLATAERQAGLATRALQLQAQANAGQTGFAALLAEMRALGEHDPAAAASASPEPGEDDADLENVCFLRPFLASEEMQQSLRAAQVAVRALGDKQRKGIGGADPVEAFAEVTKELETHYSTTLRPAWDRHSPILPWQRRLQTALRAHGKLLLETPVLTEALRTARAALLRVVRERATASPEAFHGLLCDLQAGVEGVDQGVVEEKRRRREAEAARRREAEEVAKRKRAEEAAARERACMEARARARIARLKRRRALLEEGLELERAREALKRTRATAAPGDEEDEGSGGEAEEEVVATGMRGSLAVVVEPRPVSNAERWAMPAAQTGPPLNLVSRCRMNDLSREFWAGALTAPPAERDEGGASSGRLRLRSEVGTAPERKRFRMLVVDTSVAKSALLSPTAGSANGGAVETPGSGGGGAKRKKRNKGSKKNQKGRGGAVVVVNV